VRLGLRLSIGFLLMVGLATFFVLRVFVNEVKPSVRQALESTLVDTANALAVMAAPDVASGQLAHGTFARQWALAQRRDPKALVWQFPKRALALRVTITDPRGIVVFDSQGQGLGRDDSKWNDVYRTLHGQYGARSSPERPGDKLHSVMHVAAPIYDPRDETGAQPGTTPRLIGVLTVSQPNRAFEPFIQASQDRLIRSGSWLIALSAMIAAAMTWWLVAGIRRLNRYAQAVTAGQPVPPPRLRHDELGDLGQALEDMREQLEGKAYVEHYVQSLTHELKGPLAAIRGAAELLQEPLPEAERQRFVANIQGQEQRLTETIDKLLTLAEVEQHGWLRKREVLEPAALLRAVIADAAPRAQAAEVTLTLEAAAALPSLRGGQPGGQRPGLLHRWRQRHRVRRARRRDGGADGARSRQRGSGLRARPSLRALLFAAAPRHRQAQLRPGAAVRARGGAPPRRTRRAPQRARRRRPGDPAPADLITSDSPTRFAHTFRTHARPPGPARSRWRRELVQVGPPKCDGPGR
jgi:two-component system, OmpR family, sensor histidine kinase CreC